MTKKRCAFLTMDNIEGWSIDADLAIAPLQTLNWQVDSVPWRSPDVDWDRFEAVYIGTPWDYPEDVARFIRVLEQIDRSMAVLVNDFELVRWGIPKTNLRELEARGAVIVPSLWCEHLAAGQLATFFDALSSDRLVIKPVVSTNATDTFLLGRKEVSNKASVTEQLLLKTFSRRAFVVQPFIENIQTEGEYSLFYFGGKYSHAIQKVKMAVHPCTAGNLCLMLRFPSAPKQFSYELNKQKTSPLRSDRICSILSAPSARAGDTWWCRPCLSSYLSTC